MSLGNKKRQDNDAQRQNIKKVKILKNIKKISKIHGDYVASDIHSNKYETVKEIRSIFEDVNDDIKECFIG